MKRRDLFKSALALPALALGRRHVYPSPAGHAAENGTVAADLAAVGWTASDNALESPLGFFQAEGGGFDPDAIGGCLGKPWTLVSPGVSIKPHPSGSLSHPATGEMLRLMDLFLALIAFGPASASGQGIQGNTPPMAARR